MVFMTKWTISFWSGGKHNSQDAALDKCTYFGVHGVLVYFILEYIISLAQSYTASEATVIGSKEQSPVMKVLGREELFMFEGDDLSWDSTLSSIDGILGSSSVIRGTINAAYWRAGNSVFPRAVQRVNISANISCSPGMSSTVKLKSASRMSHRWVLETTCRDTFSLNHFGESMHKMFFWSMNSQNYPLGSSICSSRGTLKMIVQHSCSGVWHYEKFLRRKKKAHDSILEENMTP